MKVIYELSPSQIEDLFELYKKEWWTSNRTLDETLQCVHGSQLCIGIVDEHDVLIGFTRVITDFTFKALIFDVIVAESSRKLGLGNKLIELVKNHPKLGSIKHFELYCLPELEQFYENNGFSSDVGGIRLMRLKNA